MSRQVDLTEQVTALDSQIDVVTKLGDVTLTSVLRPYRPVCTIVLPAEMLIITVGNGVLNNPATIAGLYLNVPPVVTRWQV